MTSRYDEHSEAMWSIARSLREIAHDLHAIRVILEPKFPTRGIITQGEFNMPVTGTITGLQPGASDTFFVTPVDVSGDADALPVGSPVPTFSADDASVTLTPAADGLSTVAMAASTATPGGSFNLTWAASYTDPTGATVNITATANVPYLAPPALLPVGGVISQGKPAV